MRTETVDLSELKAVPQDKWDKFANNKIYFGHQSVGYNIIDGIDDIVQEFPNIRLNVKETKNPAELNYPIFAHSGVGQNKNPYSKIDDFKKIMESGVADKVDIAFFKFCYVDIRKGAEINNILNYYVKVFDQLEKKYPKVYFLHCTVPLKVEENKLKGTIKKILGKPLQENEDNVLRNKFNNMMRTKYANNIIDIARFESIYLNKKRRIFKSKGKMYFALIEKYTEDGGHLNKLGKSVVAKKLILKLVKMEK